MNRSPASAIAFKTPEEMWSGNPPDYSGLKIFGCSAYVYVNDGKIEPREKKCIFLGYASGIKGYRFWCPDPKSPKFLIERNVTFDEAQMLSPAVLQKSVDRPEESVDRCQLPEEKSVPSTAGSLGSGSEQVEFESVDSTTQQYLSQQQQQVTEPVQVEETPQLQ